MLKKPLALVFTVALLFSCAFVPRAADVNAPDSVPVYTGEIIPTPEEEQAYLESLTQEDWEKNQ